MKKIFLIILASIMLFTVSCTKPKPQTNGSNEEKVVEYIVYFSSSLSTSAEFSNATDELLNDNIKITVKDNDSYKTLYLPTDSNYESEVREGKLSSRSINIGDREIITNYVKTYTYNDTENAPTLMSGLCQYDIYQSAEMDTLKISIEASSTSKPILLDFKAGNVDMNAEGDYTAEQALKLGSDAIDLIYETEEFAPFAVANTGSSIKYYSIISFRELYGYRTLERLYAMINQKGEIFSLGRSYYKAYEDVAENYTKEDIDKAYNALVALIPAGSTVDDKCLIFDENGIPHLRVSYTSSDSLPGEATISLN